jgi:hypothetical protein
VKYLLREYFEAMPDFIHEHIFLTWEQACEQFGEEMAQFNWGKNGENAPNRSDGLECQHTGHHALGGVDYVVRDDLVQEFLIIEDEPVNNDYHYYVITDGNGDLLFDHHTDNPNIPELPEALSMLLSEGDPELTIQKRTHSFVEPIRINHDLTGREDPCDIEFHCQECGSVIVHHGSTGTIDAVCHNCDIWYKFEPDHGPLFGLSDSEKIELMEGLVTCGKLDLGRTKCKGDAEWADRRASEYDALLEDYSRILLSDRTQ